MKKLSFLNVPAIGAALTGLILVMTPTGPSHAQNAVPPIGLNVASIEKVAGGFMFVEGPVWHHQTPAPGALAAASGPTSFFGDFLLFSDIPANIIYKWTESRGIEVFRTNTSAANGNTLDLNNRLITCEGFPNRRVVRMNLDGTLTTLASRYLGRKLNAPNDVVVKSDGTIYFTDPPYSTPTENLELNFFGVWKLDLAHGTLVPIITNLVRPNGIALGPGEKKLYVNDSCRPGEANPAGAECVASGSQGVIRVWDVLPDGSVANGRVFARLLDPTAADGVPDGMKVDIRGNVYSTGPGGVWVLDPNGTLLGRIRLPETAANVGWGPANWPFLLAGSRDFQTLYVTASTGLYRVRLKIPGCGRC